MPEGNKQLDEHQLWSRIHVAGNYLSSSLDNPELRETGLKMLREVMGSITFSEMPHDVKVEFLTQWRRFEQPLTDEQRKFGISAGLIMPD